MDTCIACRNHEEQGEGKIKINVVFNSWEKGGIPFGKSANGFAWICNLCISVVGGFVSTNSMFLLNIVFLGYKWLSSLSKVSDIYQKIFFNTVFLESLIFFHT